MIESLSSVLIPGSRQAERLADLSWLLIGGMGAIFVVVMAVLALGLLLSRRREEPSSPRKENWFIVSGGAIIPALIVVALLVYSLIITLELRPPREGLTVQVTGHMWWWDVRYPDSGVTIANEIYVPVGQPVRIELKSQDVIHSLWIPSLGGKKDLIPAIDNVHGFEVERPGRYWGQCAEFCGVQHARMGIYVVALSREEFQLWLLEKQKPVSIPKEPSAALGWKTFNRVGCAECHTIRGSSAQGKVGPDLTHVGSRLSLGAGVVPNNPGNMGGWIANPQALKPGNKMPPTYIEPEPFQALVTFLMDLQ